MRAERLGRADLQQMLSEARQTTVGLVIDLDEDQLAVPRLATVSPILWELGHMAWFQEKWILRHLRHQERPLLEGAEVLFDSRTPHVERWKLPLTSRQETLRYLRLVLDRVIETLMAHGDGEPGNEEILLHLLVLFHEEKHAEALCRTRQRLGYSAPRLRGCGAAGAAGQDAAGLEGDAAIPGGLFRLGADRSQLFVLDHEKWAHPVEVKPFRMARAAVTNAEFAAFVDDGGYLREEHWSPEGWAWRRGEEARHPFYWYPAAGSRWHARSFDRTLPLPDRLPVMHVNYYEAEAFCRWAGRRLPTEAEWELAASAEQPEQASERPKRVFPWGDEKPRPQLANLDARACGPLGVGALPEGDSVFGCRQMIGNVWEWTADALAPYPGFEPGLYREYAEPCFGSHRVLRGGCWFTASRLIRNTCRNFYSPDRRDVWAGFRTCALDP